MLRRRLLIFALLALLPTLAETELPARRVKRFDVPWLPSRALHLVWDQRRIEARDGGPALLERMVRATSQGFP